MSNYITTIIYICIFCIILELILPDNKFKKYIGVLISLVIILTLVSPLIDFLNEDKIVNVISNSIEDIKLNMTSSNNLSYDFSNYKDRIVLSSVKEKLENEIYTACKEKFLNDIDITKVEISLNDNYEINEVNIYAKRVNGIFSAYKIINFVEEKYNIKDFLIQVIEED